MNNNPAQASSVPPASAQAIETVLYAPWPIPIWLSVVLTAIILGGVTLLYLTERGQAPIRARLGVAVLRCSLLFMLLWMWAGWAWQQYRSDKPELLVMIDRSASMDTRDVSLSGSKDTVRRLDLVSDLFERLDARAVERLQTRYHWRFFLTDEQTEPVDWEFTDRLKSLKSQAAAGPRSHLGDALSSLIANQAGRGTAAILFFSDGINTGGSPLSAAAAQARSATIPIYCLATGRESALPDARLADLLIDDTVFLGDRVTLQVSAAASDVGEARTTVRLRDVSTGELLDEQEVRFQKQPSLQQITMSFIAKRPGEINVKVEIGEIAGESNLENNVLQRTVQVQDKTLRVLLVQKFPSLEFRFLKNLLQRSRGEEKQLASFELNSVLQEADIEYVQQDEFARRLVPSDAESLSGYDVFIFGDLSVDLISRSAQQLIFEQVTKGGAGCVFIAGRDTPLATLAGWPLGDLLPIQLDDQALVPTRDPSSLTMYQWNPTILGNTALPLQLTDRPDASAGLWQSIPPLGSLYTARAPKSGAQVLVTAVRADEANGPNPGGSGAAPLLISHFAGAGRVVLQATDETYRWTSFGGNDLYHQRYWEQMLRWVCRGRLNASADETQLIIEPRRSNLGQPIRFELRLGADASEATASSVELKLEDGTGTTTSLTLAKDASGSRQYSTVKSDLVAGNYRGVLFRPSLSKPPSAEFAIVAPPGEQTNLRADWSALRQLSEISRGRFYLPEDGQRMLEELPPGKPARFGALPEIPLWNQPWVAMLFVGLLTCEWLLRRKMRML